MSTEASCTFLHCCMLCAQVCCVVRRCLLPDPSRVLHPWLPHCHPPGCACFCRRMGHLQMHIQERQLFAQVRSSCMLISTPSVLIHGVLCACDSLLPVTCSLLGLSIMCGWFRSTVGARANASREGKWLMSGMRTYDVYGRSESTLSQGQTRKAAWVHAEFYAHLQVGDASCWVILRGGVWLRA